MKGWGLILNSGKAGGGLARQVGRKDMPVFEARDETPPDVGNSYCDMSM